jgi:quinol monooxygenase YgiN
MSKKQLDEKLVSGGGETGVSHTADPADKSATLPASKLGNGEPMKKIDDPSNTGVEETDPASNCKATGDNSASNRDSVDMKGSAASAKIPSMKEDVDALFHGEELSEEFREKATTIFEAAVTARVTEAIEAYEQQIEATLQEAKAAYEADLSEKLSSYIDYVVEQWMEENQVAIESSLKTEMTNDFIQKLHTLFVESYVEVPEDKVDVLGEMASKVEELEAKLNEALNENIQLTNQLHETARDKILKHVSEGLTMTQVEKFTTLAESVEFDSAETFEKKLLIVKENYFPAVKTTTSLNEEMLVEDEGGEEDVKKVSSGSMANYVAAISRTLKK